MRTWCGMAWVVVMALGFGASAQARDYARGEGRLYGMERGWALNDHGVTVREVGAYWHVHQDRMDPAEVLIPLKGTRDEIEVSLATSDLGEWFVKLLASGSYDLALGGLCMRDGYCGAGNIRIRKHGEKPIHWLRDLYEQDLTAQGRR